MIQTFYKEDIAKRLAAVITYGLKGKYSYGTIEERIVSSPFANRLEKNIFDGEERIEKVVEDAFGVRLEKEADISFRALFLAESYLRLFFSVNRSFEYLFLYWGLGDFANKYDVYHEMDFSNLEDDFLSAVHKTPLLRKLSLRKGINLRNVARLTGISENTINKYAKDDKYLYSCSQENGYRLSALFNVKENLFIQNIGVYLDTAVYLSDDFYRDYRNYLGLYYASYYDTRIEKCDFEYKKAANCFSSGKGPLVVLTCGEEELTSDFLDSKAAPDAYAVVFVRNSLHDRFALWEKLKGAKAREILIVGLDNVCLVKKGRRREMTETVRRSLIAQAKCACPSGD